MSRFKVPEKITRVAEELRGRHSSRYRQFGIASSSGNLEINSRALQVVPSSDFHDEVRPAQTSL